MNKEKLLTYAHKGALAELDYRRMQLERAQRSREGNEDYIRKRMADIENDLSEIEKEKRMEAWQRQSQR